MGVLPPRVLGFLNQQELIKGQLRNSGTSLLGLMLQHKEAKTGNRYPFSPHEGEPAGSLRGVRVGVSPAVGPEGWLRRSARPLVAACAGRRCGALPLLPAPCFAFRCSRRHLSRCQLRGRGSQVPACLRREELQPIAHHLSLSHLSVWHETRVRFIP